MNGRWRLGAVLRARLVQEDVAKAEVARANHESAQAAEQVRHKGRRLTARELPEEGTARAMAAALVARQSLALALADAQAVARHTDQRTAERMGELVNAAKARRTIEQLAERYAATAQAQELAADQRVIDEVGSTDGQRSAVRGAGQ